MPRKQRFKPSRKPKQAVIAQDLTATRARDDIGQTEPSRQETRGVRAVIETDDPGRSSADARAVIDDAGGDAG